MTVQSLFAILRRSAQGCRTAGASPAGPGPAARDRVAASRPTRRGIVTPDGAGPPSNPLGGFRMAVTWEQVVVDAHDPARLARWWAEALGYKIVAEAPDEVEIRRSESELPGLLFVPVPDEKTGKNRLHIDLRPEDQ